MKEKLKKEKLPTIKSLEGKVWIECRRLVRRDYPNVCYSCGAQNLQGNNNQTGHFIKKSSLPLQLKYDLRILRPQCIACNKYKHGNESFYALELLKHHGADYLLDFYEEYKTLKEEKLSVPQQRKFLQATLDRYKEL